VADFWPVGRAPAVGPERNPVVTGYYEPADLAVELKRNPVVGSVAGYEPADLAVDTGLVGHKRNPVVGWVHKRSPVVVGSVAGYDHAELAVDTAVVGREASIKLRNFRPPLKEHS
jgi:hypothetical protein